MLGMFTPSKDFISRGEEKFERAIEVYKKFFIDDAPKKIDDYYINDVI